MKSRATLSMMELLLMICVFAVAAAVCMRIFAYADSLSREKKTRDFAVTQVENAAQAVKHSGGDFARAAALLELSGSGEGFEEAFSEALEPAPEGTYRLTARSAEAEDPLLGAAEITFAGPEGEIFGVTVYWQEAAD